MCSANSPAHQHPLKHLLARDEGVERVVGAGFLSSGIGMLTKERHWLGSFAKRCIHKRLSEDEYLWLKAKIYLVPDATLHSGEVGIPA